MIGQHHIADLYGVKNLDPEHLGALMRTAVDDSGATYLDHHFDPQGSSGVILLAESHLAWHTWPEHEFISLDIYTCGNTAMPRRAVDFLVDQLQPDYVDKHVVERGRFVEQPPAHKANIAQPILFLDGAQS